MMPTRTPAPTLRALCTAAALAALTALPAAAQTAPANPAPPAPAQPGDAPAVPGMPGMPGMPMPPCGGAGGAACPMGMGGHPMGSGGMGMATGMGAMLARPATIEVTGEGQAAAAPDVAMVTVGVTVQAATAAEAMSANAARQQAVIAALKAAGIEGRDVQTSGLSLSPQTDYKEGQAPVIRGYQAMNVVTARVRALDKLGGTIDALVGAGANEIQGVQFQRQDADAIEAEARRAAVANARARAEVIAEAAGQRLGRLVAIRDTGNASGPQPVMMRYAAEAKGASTPIEGGEVSTAASVAATWEMLPKDAPAQ